MLEVSTILPKGQPVGYIISSANPIQKAEINA